MKRSIEKCSFFLYNGKEIGKRGKSVKKTFLLSILTALMLLTFASAAEFDGYLVRISRDVPMLFSEDQEGVDYVLPGLYKMDDSAFVERLLESGLAERAEPNYIIRLFDYDLRAVDTSTSWTDVLMQTNYAAELGLDGTGVRVAVIDSGLYAENLNLQEANIDAGYDYVEDSADTMSDGLGHGTKVTQMIVGDGRDGTVRGAAPEATIVPLRCFNDSGAAATADLLRAMSDAVNVYDCDVVNMSWGFTVPSDELLEAVQAINDAGAIAVAAAGNVDSSAGMPQGTLSYPAAYEQTIGIGSVDHTLTVAGSSQQTAAVYACAPGAGVIFYNTSGTLVRSSGTSFAAPCVAGAAALLKQLQPSMTTAAFCELIAERAVDLGEAGYDTAYGHGFVQMDKLLEKSWMFASNGAAGWLRNDGSTLVKAMYETSGRMAGASFTRTEKSIEAFAESLGSGETASFFLAGSDGAPLTAAIKKK